MAASSLWRHRSVLTFQGVQMLFTTYWDDPSIVGGTALATEAAARVRAFWNDLATVIASTATVSIDTTLIGLSQTTGQPVAAVSGSAPAAVTFTATGDVLPMSTQALIKYDTGQFIRGRRLRGRSYIGGLMEANSVSGLGPNAALITALNNANGRLGTTVVSSIQQVVWSRPDPAIPGSGEAWAVTARSTSSTWAVQKNRRP